MVARLHVIGQVHFGECLSVSKFPLDLWPNILSVCVRRAYDGLWLTQALIILKRLFRFTSNKNMA